MNTWYTLALPAWAIILATAIARLADIPPAARSARHNLRRIGLAGIATMATVMIASPLLASRWPGIAATAPWTFAAWSWAAVWITTEGMPPWFDFVLGVHRETEQWKARGWRARIKGELAALRDSFTPRHRRTGGK